MSIENLGKYLVPKKSVTSFEYVPTIAGTELNPSQNTLTKGVSYKIAGFANGFYGVKKGNDIWYVEKSPKDRYRIQEQPTNTDPGFSGWFNQATDFWKNTVNQTDQYANNLDQGFEMATTEFSEDVKSTFGSGISLLGNFGNWVLIVLGIVAVILISIVFMRFQ